MSEGQMHATAIVGVEYMDLDIIRTPGGAVMHMLRPDLPLSLPGEGVMQTGEIYFSEVLPGHVKAWKRHTRQTQHFCVPCGRLGIVLYDARPDSLSRGSLVDLVLGREDTYALLRIPKGIWYGFTSLGLAPAIICNAVDIPHDPAEGEKLDWRDEAARIIPFDWTQPRFSGRES